MTRALTTVSTCVSVLLALAATPYEENLARGMKTPETSSLFVRHVDAQSGVVSYFLKPELLAFNQQSFYFTAKSMTDDGRFLLFDVTPDEHAVKGIDTGSRRKALIDFLTDQAYVLKDTTGQIPWLDVERDQLWWVNGTGVHRRDLLVDPNKDIIVCPTPRELLNSDGSAKGCRFGTHITLSPDRRKIFVDGFSDKTEREGVINLDTGKWEEWGRANFCCNHGQFNPVDPTMAMCAMEYSWKMSAPEMTPEEVEKAGFEARPFMTKLARPADDIYPRLWLFRKGEHWMVPSKITGYATHEYFAEDGKGFYWCSGGVSYHDLATGREWRIAPYGATHAAMSRDNGFLTFDCNWGKWWRGCGWTICFWNRNTHRGVYIHSHNPVIAPENNQSRLHPDPHPQLVCSDRYVVCTAGDEKHRLNLSVTPVAPLLARTTNPATAPVPHRFPIAAWTKDFPTDTPIEFEIDVKALRERKLVVEPACRTFMDEYTAFALEAEVAGKCVRVPFEAVASPAYADRVILRFTAPQGATRLIYVADAPGKFEYYDSESCANLFDRTLAHDLFPPKPCVSAAPNTAVATVSCPIPTAAAGRPVKFELQMRNLSKSNWRGSIRVLCYDAAGKLLGDALNARRQDVSLNARRKFRWDETGTLPLGAVRADLVLAGINADGTASQLQLQRLNLRSARVLPFNAPAVNK